MEEKKKSSWLIWVYMSPVYIVLGLMLYRWNAKINSSDVDLSKEEYNAFNASEGEIKKQQAGGYNPNLNDGGYTVRYRSGNSEEQDGQAGGGQNRQAAGQAGETADERKAREKAQNQKTEAAGNTQGHAKSANQAALESNDTKAKDAMGLGNQKGYLSYAIGKVMGSPKAVGALLNNKYVVNGFMSRGTVKAATDSPQGLANYLKGNGPSNFLNNPVVKAAMNNPAVINAVASSGLVAAMMDTPAGKALMNDPQALVNLITSHPEMAGLMTNPDILAALANNPKTSGLLGQLNK